MLRVLRFCSEVPGITASIALFALMLLTFTDVMLRSIFNAPIEMGADLTRLLMAIIVFSVLPLLSFRGKHISVDLTDGLFTRLGLARWRDVLVAFLCGAMLILPAQRIWVLAERSRSYGDVMEYLRMPVHLLGWFIAVLTGITALALIVRAALLLIRPALLESTDA